MSDQKKIFVVAMDGSKGAKDAFQFYCSTLRNKKDTVVIVYAVEPYRSLFAEKWNNAPTKQNNELKEMLDEEASELELRLQEYADMMKTMKVGGRVRSIHTERAGKGIIDVANEISATCIVMGMRGMGTLRWTILGSVSYYVTRHSLIPVIVVPEIKDKQSIQ